MRHDKIISMPASPLLAAKLYPPPYYSSLVPRPRLVKRFEEGLSSGRKVTLVCAPAGFGKTTVVVECLENYQKSQVNLGPVKENGSRSVGWLSLEPSDNDLIVFLRYLLAALQSVIPGVGQITQDLLDGSRPLPYETLLPPLLNDLFLANTHLFLVLDDYHTIRDPVIHEAVAFLLERQPPAMHTIIISRQDPLLPLARWRARGQLMDIRLSELRFDAAETADFLNRTMGFNLAAPDVSALETRTEGWIAGLQMAAISMQQTESENDQASASEFIRAFTGDDRFIMDYLVDEVLNRQPGEVQEFLLRTSILERFNAPLCQAMLDEEGVAANPGARTAQEQLAYLEGANLFLIPLDNRRQWYRYHHLFADLLSYRLKKIHGTRLVSDLQRKASRWCDENDFPDQAIHYAQAAGDWDLCGQIILKNCPDLIRQGEVMTLLRWMRVLPPAVVQKNPYLCMNYGYVLTQSGQLKTGKEYLDLAERGFIDHPDLLGSTLAFASTNALFRGDFAEEIRLARRALELLSPENMWMRGSAASSLGMGLLHNGDPEGAEIAFHEAYQAGLKAESARTFKNALAQLGRVCILRLEFDQAESYFQRAVHLQPGQRQYPASDIPYLDLAMLRYEQNELDHAMEYVTLGLEANQRSGSAEMRAYGYRLAARLHQVQGSPVEARDYLQKALELSASFDLSPLTLSLNAALQVEMALFNGDIRSAEKAAPRVTNSLGVYPFIFYPELARVHLLFVLGRKNEALALLEPAIARAEQPGWEYPRLQVRVMQALIADSSSKAQAFLTEALILAMPANAVRTFIDLGEPMQALIRDCDLRGFGPAVRSFTRQLLGELPAVERYGESQVIANGALIEPLSEREIEVLRLVGDGLSNAEIAQKLYLSPNTLKAHTQNIYSKLDVHSRMQAVIRARELNII